MQLIRASVPLALAPLVLPCFGLSEERLRLALPFGYIVTLSIPFALITNERASLLGHNGLAPRELRLLRL